MSKSYYCRYRTDDGSSSGDDFIERRPHCSRRRPYTPPLLDSPPSVSPSPPRAPSKVSPITVDSSDSSEGDELPSVDLATGSNSEEYHNVDVVF